MIKKLKNGRIMDNQLLNTTEEEKAQQHFNNYLSMIENGN